jgi:hypothetical protein
VKDDVISDQEPLKTSKREFWWNVRWDSEWDLCGSELFSIFSIRLSARKVSPGKSFLQI